MVLLFFYSELLPEEVTTVAPVISTQNVTEEVEDFQEAMEDTSNADDELVLVPKMKIFTKFLIMFLMIDKALMIPNFKVMKIKRRLLQ